MALPSSDTASPKDQLSKFLCKGEAKSDRRVILGLHSLACLAKPDRYTGEALEASITQPILPASPLQDAY